MEINTNDLLVIIGRQTVEIQALRAQLARLEAYISNKNGAAVNIADLVGGEVEKIEVEEIKHTGEGEAKEPPWASMIDPEAARVAG